MPLSERVDPHPVFKRDGADVRMELPISMYEAALGATVEVPTPDGNDDGVILNCKKGHTESFFLL